MEPAEATLVGSASGGAGDVEEKARRSGSAQCSSGYYLPRSPRASHRGKRSSKRSPSESGTVLGAQPTSSPTPCSRYPPARWAPQRSTPGTHSHHRLRRALRQPQRVVQNLLADNRCAFVWGRLLVPSKCCWRRLSHSQERTRTAQGFVWGAGPLRRRTGVSAAGSASNSTSATRDFLCARRGRLDVVGNLVGRGFATTLRKCPASPPKRLSIRRPIARGSVHRCCGAKLPGPAATSTAHRRRLLLLVVQAGSLRLANTWPVRGAGLSVFASRWRPASFPAVPHGVGNSRSADTGERLVNRYGRRVNYLARVTGVCLTVTSALLLGMSLVRGHWR